MNIFDIFTVKKSENWSNFQLKKWKEPLLRRDFINEELPVYSWKLSIDKKQYEYGGSDVMKFCI